MSTPEAQKSGLNRWDSLVLPLVMGAALMAWPWRAHAHVDGGDEPLYRVVARHMVEDGTWFNLRYLPGVGPVFRDHLPFGFWPYAAGIRIWGERSLAPLASLFSLATLATVALVSYRLGGRSAAFVAMLVLESTRFFFYQGWFPTLDPLLISLTTAGTAPLLVVEQVRVRHWSLVWVLSALATLVKGPFGLLPLVSAITARGIVERSFRFILSGVGVSLLSLAPIACFLFWDKWRGGGTWWMGYLINQVQASALGTRNEGVPIPWLPFLVIYKKFLPGLPLLLLGLWYALRLKTKGAEPARVFASTQTRFRIVSLLCLLMALGLCLPARKLSHHTLVAFPWLAVLSGLAGGFLLDQQLSKSERRGALVRRLVALAVLVWWFSIYGTLSRYYDHHCVISLEFAQTFDQLRPGEDLWVVSRNPAWGVIAWAAAERRLNPWPATTLPLDNPNLHSQVTARIALVASDALPADLGPWEEIHRARGWVLLRCPD